MIQALGMLIKNEFPMLILLLAILASAITVFYTKHSSRKSFVVLQDLQHTRDQLNEEWGRLLIEQSTWGNPARVEQQARQQLHMALPTAANIEVIKW
jgi:cell division protein FtsL